MTVSNSGGLPQSTVNLLVHSSQPVAIRLTEPWREMNGQGTGFVSNKSCGSVVEQGLV